MLHVRGQLDGVNRDVGTTTGRFRPALRSFSSGAAALFAARIRHRLEGRAYGALPLETIWRRPALSVSSVFASAPATYRAENYVTFAPLVKLTVLNRFDTGMRPTAAPPAPLVPAPAAKQQAVPVPAGESTIAMRLLTHRLPRQIERTETNLQRFERFTREITLHESTLIPTVRTQRREVMPARPQEPVFVRQQAPVAASHTANVAKDALNAPLMPPSAPVPAAGSGAPQIDVNRLAEQVIQAIDQRLIASRERRGRI